MRRSADMAQTRLKIERMPRSMVDARVRHLGALRGICTFGCSFLPAMFASSTAAFQPLITDDTGTQGAGGNQVELALNRQEVKGAGDTTITRTLPLVFTRGITDALDLYA